MVNGSEPEILEKPPGKTGWREAASFLPGVRTWESGLCFSHGCQVAIRSSPAVSGAIEEAADFPGAEKVLSDPRQRPFWGTMWENDRGDSWPGQEGRQTGKRK
ncbi:UNVERIFIED_CONTAM: hypothetical protein K2H54_064189 [Gekko kuhli]